MNDPFTFEEDLHKPYECSVCGRGLVYVGLGEYECKNEKCRHIERDDYGKVRTYLEVHHKANLAIVSENTGVSRKVIQKMLDEGRFETDSSKRINADE